MSLSFEWFRRPFQQQDPLEVASIAAWENASGYRLPEDYRVFLLRTNGGCIRPHTFELAIPDFADDARIMELMFDWERAHEESQFDIKPEARSFPPERLAIGITSCEMVITLSLAPATHGTIEVWPSDPINPWGEEPNTTIVPLAPSFSHFMALLRHERADDDYYGPWTSHDEAGVPAERISIPSPV